MSHPVRFMIVGTASYDIVRLHPGMEHFLGSKHDSSPDSYEAPGGGAPNMFDGLKRLARATGLHFHADVFTKIGPGAGFVQGEKHIRNPHAQDLYDALHGHAVHDMVRHQQYAVPTNIVICGQDRGVSKDWVSKAFGDATTPLDPDTFEHIEDIASDADYILLQSRYADVANHACATAHAESVVITDLDVKTGEAAERLMPTLLRSDVIIAPGESILPGMDKADPNALFDKLIHFSAEHGGRAKLIAVSNGGRPVMYYHNGEVGQIEQEKVTVVDNNGTGDRRDAFLGAGMAMGMNPVEALRQASDLAGFIVQYPDTQWAQGGRLEAYLRQRQLFGMKPDALRTAPMP